MTESVYKIYDRLKWRGVMWLPILNLTKTK